eukprot:429923-Pyramimonas_sp.AAC.1
MEYDPQRAQMLLQSQQPPAGARGATTLMDREEQARQLGFEDVPESDNSEIESESEDEDQGGRYQFSHGGSRQLGSGQTVPVAKLDELSAAKQRLERT